MLNARSRAWLNCTANSYGRMQRSSARRSTSDHYLTTRSAIASGCSPTRRALRLAVVHGATSPWESCARSRALARSRSRHVGARRTRRRAARIAGGSWRWRRRTLGESRPSSGSATCASQHDDTAPRVVMAWLRRRPRDLRSPQGLHGPVDWRRLPGMRSDVVLVGEWGTPPSAREIGTPRMACFVRVPRWDLCLGIPSRDRGLRPGYRGAEG
jgi:hypothetical protein